MSGACVRRARLQAADGMPMPTKQMSLLRSAREAAITIISLAVWVMSLFRRNAQARGMHGERLRPFVQHVGLHPGQEAVAVAGDLVPGEIEGIVARVVAVRVGRMRAARHTGDGADRP